MNTSAVSPGRAGLLLLLTGQMLPLIDTSITNVALDSITLSLHTNTTQLSLIVALYGVAFAVCLAMGSKLGDNFGRRKMFLWGVALFGIACAAVRYRQLHHRPARGAYPARDERGADHAANSRNAARDPQRYGPCPRYQPVSGGLAAWRLSSGRWVAAGWYRQISPGSAGETPFLLTCR